MGILVNNMVVDHKLNIGDPRCTLIVVAQPHLAKHEERTLAAGLGPGAAAPSVVGTVAGKGTLFIGSGRAVEVFRMVEQCRGLKQTADDHFSLVGNPCSLSLTRTAASD